MPTENPRRRRRAKRKTPRQYKSGPKKGQFMSKRAVTAKRKPRKRTTRKRTTRRKNPTLATLAGNPRRKRRSPTVAKRRRRYTAKRKKSYKRRNPAGFKIAGFKLPPFQPVAFGVVGMLGAQALPRLVVPGMAGQPGFVGLAVKLAGAAATGMVVKMVAGSKAGTAALVGAGIGIASEWVQTSGVLANLPGLSGTEAVGLAPYPMGGYIDAPLTGFVDASQTPAYLPELATMGGFASDYEHDYLAASAY